MAVVACRSRGLRHGRDAHSRSGTVAGAPPRFGPVRHMLHSRTAGRGPVRPVNGRAIEAEAVKGGNTEQMLMLEKGEVRGRT